MTKERASELIRRIMDGVSGEEYPESIDVIVNTSFPGDGGIVIFTESLYGIASQLHTADGSKDMHPLIAQFVLEVYFDEYVDGNADAACDLGALYYTGRAGEQSYSKAVEYYNFAAEHGCRRALENLGYCYYYGRDVEVDYEKAYNCFIKGALTGELVSLYKIGDMYRNGYYVEKDESQAFAIYDHCAAMLNDSIGQECRADIYYRLAQCYYHGIGTEPEYNLALGLYQMAEGLYYERVKNGDFMIRGNLETVIREEEEVRRIIMASLA